MKKKLLAYQQSGQGENLVLIHGFCENRSIWDAFIPELSKQYKVISLDLAGFGDSVELLDDSTSVEAMAVQVKELMDYLLCSKVILVGHSLGGYVSLAFAYLYPGMVQGLMLFNSTAHEDTPERKRNREHVMELVSKKGTAEFLKTFIGSLFHEKKGGLADRNSAIIREMVLKTSPNTIVKLSKAMRDRPDRLDVIRNANYPVGFIIGKDDHVLPMEQYKEQVFLPPYALIYTLENTGHVAMLEKEEESLAMLVSFLSYVVDFSKSNA